MLDEADNDWYNERDRAIPYREIYAEKLNNNEMEERRKFFIMMYGFNEE